MPVSRSILLLSSRSVMRHCLKAQPLANLHSLYGLQARCLRTPYLVKKLYVYPFQFKMSEGFIYWNGYLLVPSGTLLRKAYTGSASFLTF